MITSILSYVSSLDSSILYAIQSIGPTWRPVAMFLSYGLGYWSLIVAFLVALFLLRRHRVALELIVVVIVSLAATLILKEMFHAARPYVVDPSVIKYDTDSGPGLPSAHALMTMVVLGWIVIRHPKSRILVWGSVSLVLLIGLSRIYLGVHYPSQVLAGWLFGILFLYIFRVIDKRLWAPFQKKLR
ncbi:MAG TPA: phosphatase PAP2 family protein [Candidatus Paceibacterota bacterium]|nr:phosphatase PAP2 family protein [Candidatus Paceibacterota bacterium]